MDFTRTADETELETVNHHLTLYYSTRPDLHSEIVQYKTAQTYLETVAGDADATHLLLTLAKDQYRLVFGYCWLSDLSEVK